MPTPIHTVFDEAALETLFKEHFKPLCAYCQSRFGFELDEAKEVVHMGFIKLWEIRETISPDLSVKAYLYKMVANLSLDMLKHEKVKQKYARHVFRTTTINTQQKEYDDSELRQLMADIDNAVSGLPDQMRKVFELNRYEGLKYAEIASQLQISVKTVETQMSRALVKLRERLAHYLTIIIMTFFLNQ